MLDKTDHLILAKYLGRAFALLVAEKISRITFDIYAAIIRDLNPYLLRQMTQIYAHEGMMAFDPPAAVQLSNYGLMDVTIRTTITNSETLQKGYTPTKFGKQFYDVIIAPDIDSNRIFGEHSY